MALIAHTNITTIWDFICRTARPKYLAELDQIKARVQLTAAAVPATAEP